MQDVDLEEIAKRFVKLVLVEVGFAPHQLRLGGQVAFLANIKDRLKRRASLFKLTQPEQRLPRQIVELSQRRVARGSPPLL